MISKRSFFIAIGAIGLTLGLTAAPASAQTTNTLLGNYNFCTGNSQCLNLQDGSIETSDLQFWSYGTAGEPNNDWNIWRVGYVGCSSNSFPFYTTDSTLLSLCSSSYQGDEVLKFAWAPNSVGSGYCLSVGFTVGGDDGAILNNCVAAGTEQSAQYFIYNPSTDHVVNITRTASSYENDLNQIYWLDSCESSESNGVSICIGTNTLDWYIQNKP